jgi:hypothetical protein
MPRDVWNITFMNTTETETFVRQHPPRQILSDLYGYAWDISDHTTRKAWEYVNVTGERRTLTPVSDAQESLFNNVLRGTGAWCWQSRHFRP